LGRKRADNLLSPINFLRVVDDMDEEEDATAGARLRCRRFVTGIVSVIAYRKKSVYGIT
jgi:hypothetical protein